jgi:hypothetical protein
MPVSAVNGTGSASLGITPRKDYLVEPGKSVSDSIVIRNLDQSQPLELTLRVVDFTYTGNDGTPKLMLAEDAPQTTWSLIPFLTVPETVTVPAGGSKSVNIKVSIPANQGAGSYYSAVLYSTGAPNGGNVGLSASGVTLVFTTVPGQVNEKLTLQKFGAYASATASSPAKFLYFTGEQPLNIGYMLQNTGNVAEAPVGSITYKYMFGKAQTITNVNPNQSLALIGQSRTFVSCFKTKDTDVSLINDGSSTTASTCITPGLWPGYYSLSLDLFYGLNGNLTQEIIGHGGFWYLPTWFLIVLFVVLVILAFVIWRLVVRVRNTIDGAKMKRSLRRRRK